MKKFPNDYVPTLAIRSSEMRALDVLPKKIQNRITPCILLAPWTTSKSLKHAIRRVEKSFPGQNYFLDIDRDYQYSNHEKPAQQEFRHLSNTANWIEFIKESSHICPCIQFERKSEAEIQQQIEVAEELGRQYCVRIERSRFPRNFSEITSTFATANPDHFTIILEGGLIGQEPDIPNLSAWFEDLIIKDLQKIHANVPIVVSYTSIPKMFANFNGINSIKFHNRDLVQQIQRKSNQYIIYGDWGSTRPRENSSGGVGGKHRTARIDYPVDDAWYIVRNKEKDWSFKKAAQELVSNKEVWDDSLDIWGMEMIRWTADSDKEVGIISAQVNTASRVNIHLHRQALYGQENELRKKTPDGIWED